MRSLAGGRCAQQVSDARRAASWQPFGEHSRCNHDVIMIRLVSHQWHSASDERISGQSARAASERSAGRLLAAPLGKQQRCNHDAIMIMMMNYRWQSAGDGSGRCSARSARAARERQPALPSEGSGLYRSRADAAAAAGVTPARAINCARVERRVGACAAEARGRERLLVSEPTRGASRRLGRSAAKEAKCLSYV